MPGFAFYASEDRASIHQTPAWDSLAASWGWDLHVIDPTCELCIRGYSNAYESLADLVTAHPSTQFVYLFGEDDTPAGWSTTALPDFTHPSGDAIYVFGDNRTGIVEGDLSTQNGSLVLHIEVGETDPSRTLWAFDAGLVVIYDRFLKNRLNL